MLTKLTMSTNFWSKLLRCAESNPFPGLKLSVEGQTITYTKVTDNLPITLFTLEGTGVEEVCVGDIYGNAVICKITPIAEMSDRELSDKISALVDFADSSQRNDPSTTKNVQANSEVI